MRLAPPPAREAEGPEARQLGMFPEVTGAEWSPCRRYRYRLWRRWGLGPTCCFIMLNPSTADDVVNDPTVERCCRRAKTWGYGGLEVVNLFAWRATDPRELKRVQDPVGPDNYRAIGRAIKESEIVVLAWGKHGSILGMGADAMHKMRKHYRDKARVLKLNHDGSPAHPLYLPYSLEPQRLPEPP